MKEFVIEIVGSVFCVHSLFESTRDYCRDYWTERQPEYTVIITVEDLLCEQELLNAEADEEGLKRRRFSDPFLERSVLQRKIAEILFDLDVLLMHGSTVSVDGQAYLFTAACGTGKSTHTRFWCDLFAERAQMVNDDKPFLRLNKDSVLAYGSPWTGKHGLGNHICCPLKGICILKRGTVNRIRRICVDEARSTLMHQCFQPEERLEQAAVMVERLMYLVPLWEMECIKDPSAALMAWDAMSSCESE